MAVKHGISYIIERGSMGERGVIILIALFVEFRPVSNGAVQSTDMNVVKMINRVHPIAAAVVYFEMKVR